jgi:hypothetical protein
MAGGRGVKPTLTADTREPKGLLKELEALCARDAIPLLVRALNHGDYHWEVPGRGVVLVERKTVPDLLSSLADGRWSRQLSELAQADLGVVLLCGRLDERDGMVSVGESRGRGKAHLWSFAAVARHLFVCQMLGVTLALGPGTVSGDVGVLVGLYNATLAVHHTSLVRKPPSFLASESERGALHVLISLPGMGPVLAKRLLRHFGSPLAALYGVAYPVEPLPGVSSTLQRRWASILTHGERHSTRAS